MAACPKNIRRLVPRAVSAVLLAVAKIQGVIGIGQDVLEHESSCRDDIVL